MHSKKEWLNAAEKIYRRAKRNAGKYKNNNHCPFCIIIIKHYFDCGDCILAKLETHCNIIKHEYYFKFYTKEHAEYMRTILIPTIKEMDENDPFFRKA